MNRPTRFLAALAALACAGSVWAQEEKVLNVVALNEEVEAIAEAPVSLESSLRFTAEGVEVYGEELLSAVFNYTDMNAFAFRYDTQTGISLTPAASGLSLRTNPVVANLELLGHSGEATRLTVTDLRGTVKASAEEWTGEPVDVSALAPGLYFVTVNKTTLKFIKK